MRRVGRGPHRGPRQHAPAWAARSSPRSRRPAAAGRRRRPTRAAARGSPRRCRSTGSEAAHEAPTLCLRRIPAWQDRASWQPPAQWLEGARPRTLPAAVAPVLAGHRGRGLRRRRGVVEGGAGAASSSLALQVGRQLRQRLLRRHPRHRRRPGRPAAAGRLGRRRPGVGEGGGVRARSAWRWSPAWCWRPRRPGGWCSSARCAVRRRVVLHRRLDALRLPGARRGHGLRVLRARRGGRHDVRPDRDAAAARAGTPPSGSARWPARSWSPTTCATSRPTARSASAPWPSCSATTRTRGALRAAGRRRGWSPWSASRCRRRCLGAAGPRRSWCPVVPRGRGRCSAGRPAATWCRCCSSPASPSCCTAAGVFVGLLLGSPSLTPASTRAPRRSVVVLLGAASPRTAATTRGARGRPGRRTGPAGPAAGSTTRRPRRPRPAPGSRTGSCDPKARKIPPMTRNDATSRPSRAAV